MIFKISLVLFACFCATSQGIDFNCEYRNTPWPTYAVNFYTCYMIDNQVTASKNPTALETLQGDHIFGKTNNDVKGLYVQKESTKMMRLPKGVEKFFPNIIAIEWYAGNLVSITAEDLKPFPELRVLGLANNWITSLDGDLFKYTPKLRFINFYNNQISTVGLDLFNGLYDLTAAYFVNNRCIDTLANTPQEVQEVKNQLEARCAPPTTPAPLTTPGPSTKTTASTSVGSTTENTCRARCTINEEVDELERKLASMGEYWNKFNEFVMVNFTNSTDRISQLEKALQAILDILSH